MTGPTGESALVEFLLDLVAEGWLPHPFVQRLSEKCAMCGATADRAVHDRRYAESWGITWERVLVSLSGRSGPGREH